MKMNSFCVILRVNAIDPVVFFDKIPADDIVKIKQRIDAAITGADAQKIINDYV